MRWRDQTAKKRISKYFVLKLFWFNSNDWVSSLSNAPIIKSLNPFLQAQSDKYLQAVLLQQCNDMRDVWGPPQLTIFEKYSKSRSNLDFRSRCMQEFPAKYPIDKTLLRDHSITSQTTHRRPHPMQSWIPDIHCNCMCGVFPSPRPINWFEKLLLSKTFPVWL